MLLRRLIPSLLIDSQLRLVKTVSFGSATYLGDPLNAAYVFSGFEVDELLVLDIEASQFQRCIPTSFLQSLAQYTRVPLTVGGGISTLDQIASILAVGVERVVLSSVLSTNFKFLNEAVQEFGSSTISTLINYQSPLNQFVPAWFGRPGFSHIPARNLYDLLQVCEDSGAGEVIIYNADRDGTYSGLDHRITAISASHLSIPLVSIGGCSGIDDLNALQYMNTYSSIGVGSSCVYAPFSTQVLLRYKDLSDALNPDPL